LSSSHEQRLADVASAGQVHLLKCINRGLEKESLRIDPDGRLAQTPHPAGLGSALTHAYITTDYSEALLEFITPVSTTVEDSLATLEDIHRFTHGEIGDELLWSASMPCILGDDDQIPVARYGTSNVARMKTVYREGLGHRYGRLMQTIAGIHYNFSMPEAWWERARVRDGDERPLRDYITDRYLGLIRNFRRWSWLLIYLYGASPAVCASFLRDGDHQGLEPFDERARSLHAPFGTSLRMGDLGYQSNAQQNLSICYNNLDSYIATLKEAITEPHPEYVAIGTGDKGHQRQLNTSLLQIENEFYSPIRPKRVTRSGETPLCALRRDGVEYVEVRCIDVNPYLPLGIDAAQIRFLDMFLLHCLLADSPECDDDEAARNTENQLAVVNRGREPGITLRSASGERAMTDLAADMLDLMEPIAAALDVAHGDEACCEVLSGQREKLRDPSLTPSAQILADMQHKDLPFFTLSMEQSRHWAEYFAQQPLAAARLDEFRRESEASLQRQRAVEAANDIDFETYLERYYRQYDSL
jgi:glutamate--cysteine ligase